MGTVPSHEHLTRALAAAGAAHHDYEVRFLSGVRDEEWPGWYAAYVLGRLGDFISPTSLARWLEAVQADGDWAPTAATFVLSQIESR